MKTIVHAAMLCLAVQACGTNAHAHAFLDRARPAVGSAIHGSPAEIRLWFTTPLEGAFSTVKVLDKNGKQVDRNDKQLDRSDPTLLKVSVPPLPNGTYRVLWHTLSVDAHVTEGDFTFEVLP